MNKAYEEDVEKLNETMFQTGDALDAKASFVLVIITLLAAFSIEVLRGPDLSPYLKALQGLAVAAIVAGVAASICALWPMAFDVRPMPEAWEKSMQEFIAESATKLKIEPSQITAVQVLEEFNAARQRVALRRLAANREIVAKKAKRNNIAFYATTVAIVFETACLLMLLLANL